MERGITLLSLHKFDSSVLSGMWSDQVSVLANRSRRKSVDRKFVTAGFAEDRESRCSEHAGGECILVFIRKQILQQSHCRMSSETTQAGFVWSKTKLNAHWANIVWK